jgi:hypothetical protein
MPSTDRKLELKAKTSVAQTLTQPCVYAKGLTSPTAVTCTICHLLYARNQRQMNQMIKIEELCKSNIGINVKHLTSGV